MVIPSLKHLEIRQSLVFITLQFPNYKIESFHICEHINDCIEQLLNNNYKDDLAVGGSRQNILNSPSYSPSKIYCFDRLENIRSYSIALYMQKRFYLKEKVNDIITELFKGGLLEKWDKQSQMRRKYEVAYTIPLRLPVTHIMVPIVFVLGVGSFMSISTFIVEIYVFWKIEHSKHKIWIYLEQFFDGQRHYLKNVPERLQELKKHSISETYYPYVE